MGNRLTLSGIGAFLFGWFGNMVVEVFPMTGWELPQELARIIIFVCLAFMFIGMLLIVVSFRRSTKVSNKQIAIMQQDITNKYIDAFIQANVVWGLWFSGTRVRVEKGLDEVDSARILLMNPGSQNKGLIDVVKRADVPIDAVQSDINHFTKYILGMPKNIEVGWYSEYRGSSFSIFDPTPTKELSGELTPNSENAWIILSLLDPNVGPESRLTTTIHKKKEPRKFDGYYSEFKEWWSRREKIRLQGGNLTVDK